MSEAKIKLPRYVARAFRDGVKYLPIEGLKVTPGIVSIDGFKCFWQEEFQRFTHKSHIIPSTWVVEIEEEEDGKTTSN